MFTIKTIANNFKNILLVIFFVVCVVNIFSDNEQFNIATNVAAMIFISIVGLINRIYAKKEV